MASKKLQSRKYELAEQLESLFDEYKSVLVVACDNVGSNQMHEIRKVCRGKCVIYCGKNTQMRRVLRKLEENGRPELDKLRGALKLNVALVFTNESLAPIADMLMENKMPAPAKAGTLAQCAVRLEKGMTNLEPTQTNFLQALNIGSKITKGMIEIINDVTLFEEGDKIDASQAALLQKMDILPFAYGLVVIKAFDDGSLFDADVLRLTDDIIVGKFKAAAMNVAAISIEVGQPNLVSVPYSILLAYSNLLAITDQTKYSFKLADKFWSGASAAAAAPAASGGAAAAPAKEESEEEEEMAPATNLFGDDGDDY
jgi:large subunit ribosomal protein LP0